MTDFRQQQLQTLQQQLRDCRACTAMQPPPITGEPTLSSILLIGQAPGAREPELQRPFAWTAGKTLFKWFAGLGVDEPDFRQRVYIAAVCRCFPGKKPRGGDRVPNREEIANCEHWLQNEVALLQPQLLLPVGKLAIETLLGKAPLTERIGRLWTIELYGHTVDVIPLPHPSGASTWHVTEPGKTLLQQALHLLKDHPVFNETFGR